MDSSGALFPENLHHSAAKWRPPAANPYASVQWDMAADGLGDASLRLEKAQTGYVVTLPDDLGMKSAKARGGNRERSPRGNLLIEANARTTERHVEDGAVELPSVGAEPTRPKHVLADSATPLAHTFGDAGLAHGDIPPRR